MNLFPVWDWPTAVALVAIGVLAGFTLLPTAWPLRLAARDPLPIATVGFLTIALPSTFFLFLTVLRVFRELPPPMTTWAQWIVFAIGMTIGAELFDRKRLQRRLR